MKIIKNINDFVDLVNSISTEQPIQEFIDTKGLAKFKSNIYEVSQHIDNALSPEDLSPANKRLFNALSKLNNETREKLSQAMLTSYYTPESIISPVQELLLTYYKENNFERIDICEPSAGTGNFIYKLQEDKNFIDAVELDPFTSSILTSNIKHPNVTIHNTGYENFKPTKKYDLIIGNIPFGNYNIYDQELSKKEINIVNGQIHNYFFLKSVENLKPGGILSLMTTSSMNDSANGKLLREYLMENTNLISCIRFNDNTFKESNTKVISDLLIIQKPLEKKISLSDREKMYVNTVPSALKPETNTNAYVNSDPAHLMGEYYLTSGYAGKEIVSVKDNGLDYTDIFSTTLQNDFEKFSLKNITSQILIEEEKIDQQALVLESNAILKDYPNVVLGNIIQLKNDFFKVAIQKENRALYTKTPVTVALLDRESLSLLIQIRENYKNLKNYTKEEDPDRKIVEKLHSELENNYDLFNFTADAINNKRNSKLLSYDIESDLLRGLEKLVNGEFVKSNVFDIEFIQEEEIKIKATSIQDAIALSYSNYAAINQDYISEIYNKPFDIWADEALKEGLLFVNPIITNFNKIKSFELCIPTQFKSGYIDGKLDIYNDNSLLLQNINPLKHLLNKENIQLATEALIDVIPFKLTIEEINPSLGETWIPLDYYQLFGKQHFDCNVFKLGHIEALDKYSLRATPSQFAHQNYSVSTENRNVSFDKIFEMAMIHTIPEYTIETFKNGVKSREVDKKTINAVNYNITKLNAAFTQWLVENPTIAADLETKYHLLNNAVVKENFNISLLNFDNIVGKTPYDHQKAAVWQNITQMGGIIDHEVGFGKTLTMAMTTMKKIELGLIKKELVVGKNANYKELYQAYKDNYPKGNFLLVQPEDVSEKKKQETFYRIINNNYDAVFIAHSTLISFPKAPFQEKKILEEIIGDLRDTILADKEDRLMTSGEMNKLNKSLIDSESNLKYAIDTINKRKSDGNIIFDDLKFDSITVDESHDFKNLKFVTKHTRVAGLGNKEAVQKTDNLLAYIRNIQTKNGGDKGITFASGTTISNSITEMYLLFKYLIPTKLAEKKINNFDQWARIFARKTNEYEESVSGQVKQKERFRYFVKVPELAKIYNDITNYADINTFKIDRPEGQIQLIAVEPFLEQQEYMENVKMFGQTKNLNYLHNYKGDPQNAKKAVGLICTAEGKKAALCLKLIDPNFPEHPQDKIHTMADKVLENYQKFDSDRGTQLIFCDQGVPNGKNFNLYAHMKDILISKGIPPEQIAFIHSWDNKKEKLFSKVNAGEIRVVIGSTGKMGVGVNMQKRITAMHHLDFPWRPTDMIQRNGRGERTGNIVLPKFDNKLDIFCYATKNSLDAYTFNLLQIKHNFIMQIKNASVKTRTVDEGVIDQKGNLNFAEYMAACSSNQYLTERLGIEKKLNLAIDLKITLDQQNRQNTRKLERIYPEINTLQKNVERFKNDHKLAESIVPFTDIKIAKELRERLTRNINNRDFKSPLMSFAKGFEFVISAKYKEDIISLENYSVLLKTPNGFRIGYKSNSFTKDEKEVMNYLSNCINRLPELIKNAENNLQDTIAKKDIIEKLITSSFSNTHEIKGYKEQIEAIDLLIEKENNKDLKQEKEQKEETTTKNRVMSH
jgi:N12 class adenine-specific DNA methylase